MAKLSTNCQHFWVEKPQTDEINYNHDKAFRDLGSGFDVLQFKELK